VSVTDPSSLGVDVVTLGETMALMKAETFGPLAHADSLSMSIGGAETNVAIGLQRLGCSTAWVGRVGEDSLGTLVVRELRAEGIRVHAHVDPSAPTGLMLKERRTPASQQVWYYRSQSAGSKLAQSDIPRDLVANARVLHVTGITPAISKSAADSVDWAIECARAAGTVVSFDVNYRSRLWQAGKAEDTLRDLARRADIVFAGEDEAALIVGAGGDDMDLARRLSSLGPSQAIVKRGAKGCTAVIDGVEYRQQAVPVDVVDTVGAGDAFVAGYLAELLGGVDPVGRLHTAVRTGAFACTAPGDWEGTARRSELAMLNAVEGVTR
jgi:2-dehydro-3-deoxygluconokinase